MTTRLEEIKARVYPGDVDMFEHAFEDMYYLINCVEKLDNEMKNFLACFDEYYELRGKLVSPQKAEDAKQAMFSAAIQARKVLEE